MLVDDIHLPLWIYLQVTICQPSKSCFVHFQNLIRIEPRVETHKYGLL